jgi:hypothetical protein
MSRRLAALLLVLASLLAVAAPASAADASLERGRQEIAKARVMVSKALEADK